MSACLSKKIRWNLVRLCCQSTLLLISATAAVATPLEWMGGRWCAQISDNTTIEEQWFTDAGNRMLGLNRTLKDGRAVAFEYLQVDLQGATPIYLAQPGGKPATGFSQVADGDHWVRFENLQHDYPQFIEYRRDGSALTATIGAGDGQERRESAFSFQICADDNDANAVAGPNQWLVNRYVQAHNDCDLPGAAQLMHPDIQWLTISGSQIASAANGKQALVAELDSYMADGCSTRSELSQWSINGRFVTVIETAHWTPDDGIARSQSATAVYEVAAEKILNVWYYPAVKQDQ